MLARRPCLRDQRFWRRRVAVDLMDEGYCEGRLCSPRRGRLPLAHQPLGRVRSRAVADVYAAQRRRGSLPNPQAGPVDPAHLPPARTAGRGARVGLLSRLRHVPHPPKARVRPRPADDRPENPQRTIDDQEWRRRTPAHQRSRASATTSQPPGPPAKRASHPPRPRIARAPRGRLHQRTRVVQTFPPLSPESANLRLPRPLNCATSARRPKGHKPRKFKRFALKVERERDLNPRPLPWQGAHRLWNLSNLAIL